MTIEKGQDWGTIVPRPADLLLATGDAELVEAITDAPDRAIGLAGGDLRTTLGRSDVSTQTELRRLPIDLLRIVVDGSVEYVAAAHVTMQSPTWRGGWWFGPVTMVMNAEFLGRWHVATRGHPNDGRAEVCSWQSDLGLRQRIEARRRLPTSSHVPHPLIATRSVRSASFAFARPVVVRVDGRRRALGRRVDVRVDPDAAVIHA